MGTEHERRARRDCAMTITVSALAGAIACAVLMLMLSAREPAPAAPLGVVPIIMVGTECVQLDIDGKLVSATVSYGYAVPGDFDLPAAAVLAMFATHRQGPPSASPFLEECSP